MFLKNKSNIKEFLKYLTEYSVFFEHPVNKPTHTHSFNFNKHPKHLPVK